MAGWHHKHHVIFHERLDVQVFALLWALDQCEMNLPGQESFQHLVRVPAPCSDVHSRLRSQEARNQIGKKVLSDGLRSTESKLACLLSAGLCYGGDCLFTEAFHAVRKRQKCLPALREGDTSTTTVKEGNPELFLKRFDLLRHRRLREEQLLRGTAEVEVVRNGTEHTNPEVLEHQRTTTSMPKVW